MRAILLLLCVVGGVDAEPQKDFTSVKPEDLGVKPVPEAKDPTTGFVVGGKNTTALIKSMKELAGRSIADLEKDMRPGAATEVGSDKGFIGEKESLLEVIAADNAYVVDELGLTHQELARHLRVLAAIGQQLVKDESDKTKAIPFLYHGRKFTVVVSLTRGYQLSPFKDGTKTNADAKLTNLNTGKVLEYSLLVPDMVERYGFYEGQGTPYRMDPKDVMAVLDFLKRKN